MAQVVTLVCDRCKTTHVSYLRTITVVTTAHETSTHYTPKQVEICKECISDLALWLTCYEKVPSEG